MFTAAKVKKFKKEAEEVDLVIRVINIYRKQRNLRGEEWLIRGSLQGRTDRRTKLLWFPSNVDSPSDSQGRVHSKISACMPQFISEKSAFKKRWRKP